MNISTSYYLAENIGLDPLNPVIISGSCGIVILVKGKDVERYL